jgi:hypothetical protein
MRQLTRRVIPIAALLTLFAVADAEAQWNRHVESPGQFRVRFGLLEPSGGSDGWDNVFEGFTGNPSELRDFVWGTDVLWRTGRNTGFLFGASFYRGKTTSAYEDWVASDGSEVRHTTTLEMADLTAAFVFRFGRSAVRPYLGLGGGFLWYTLTDEGNFIDFSSPGQPVFYAWYGAEATTFEAFALGGLEIPINPAWALLVEGRYRYASDTLGQDFSGFGELDLSGWELTGGFGINF